MSRNTPASGRGKSRALVPALFLGLVKVACGLLVIAAVRELLKNEEKGRPAATPEAFVPPHRHDIVDEESEESFPASDPPANY